MDVSNGGGGPIAAVLGLRNDGLGARLMCMGNGIRLASRFGCGFGYLWTTHRDLASISAPSELFDVPAMAAAGLRFLNMSEVFVHADHGRLVYVTGSLRTLDMATVPAGATLLVTCAANLLLRDEAVIAARQGLRTALEKIIPAPRIAERAAAFMGQHDLTSAIGIHVRRGDIDRPEYPRRNQRVVHLDQYFAMLDVNRTRDENIFLCTEDRAVIDAFEARYPKRVLCFPTRTWDRSDSNGAEDALIEIIALSRTAFVISGASSFSRAATGLGFKPLLGIVNAPSDDSRNYVGAALEFLRFGMPERAAANLAAFPSEPESELLATIRKRIDRALAASQARVARSLGN